MQARPDPTAIHLTKLAVGVPSLDAFEERVADRRKRGEGMQVWTRSFPKRAADIIGSGSLYWVVAGLLAARQPVLAIEDDRYADGSRCTRIELEPILIRVLPRPVRPFQGWRYLTAEKTPADWQSRDALGVDELPASVLRQLQELCLL